MFFFQSFLPLIFIIAPLAILFVLIYSRMAVGPYASFVSVLLNWQPCPQVFIALTFLSPFRRRIRAILRYDRRDSVIKKITLVAHSAPSNGRWIECSTPPKYRWIWIHLLLSSRDLKISSGQDKVIMKMAKLEKKRREVVGTFDPWSTLGYAGDL